MKQRRPKIVTQCVKILEDGLYCNLKGRFLQGCGVGGQEFQVLASDLTGFAFGTGSTSWWGLYCVVARICVNIKPVRSFVVGITGGGVRSRRILLSDGGD
jgi:hypothetical protein